MNTIAFAIDMELTGEKYYKEQAAKNLGNRLNTVLQMLAKEENNHANILKRRLRGSPYDPEDLLPSQLKNIFTGIPDFAIEIKPNPEQVDLYRMALDKEMESIALYKTFLTDETKEKELFQYLIGQEEEHARVLEDIIKLVDRPNNWVESAEFGLREEY